jgi:hypothetical protein
VIGIALKLGPAFTAPAADVVSILAAFGLVSVAAVIFVGGLALIDRVR